MMVLELQARAHYHLLNTVRMTLDGEAVRHKLTALNVRSIRCTEDCHIPESSCSKTHLKRHLPFHLRYYSSPCRFHKSTSKGNRKYENNCCHGSYCLRRKGQRMYSTPDAPYSLSFQLSRLQRATCLPPKRSALSACSTQRWKE